MRETEDETNLMRVMLKKDFEEAIKVERQRLYSTLAKEEDDDGSTMKTMREELKKNLDDFREDDNGWRRFVPQKEGRTLIPSYPALSAVSTSSALGVPLTVLVSGKLATMIGRVK